MVSLTSACSVRLRLCICVSFTGPTVIILGKFNKFWITNFKTMSMNDSDLTVITALLFSYYKRKNQYFTCFTNSV